MMYKWLFLPAIALVVGAIIFWIWVDKLLVYEPKDTPERFALFQELRKLRKGDPIPESWIASAKKLGADPQQARKELDMAGQKDADERLVWERALDKPVREAVEKQNLYMYYRERRLPILYRCHWPRFAPRRAGL